MDASDPYRHPPPGEITASGVLRALGDPTRLAIVRRLAEAEPRDLTCGEFGCATKQLATHHLRVLREAGVTATRESGRNRYVRLRRDVLDVRFPGLLDAVVAASRDGITPAATEPVHASAPAPRT